MSVNALSSTALKHILQNITGSLAANRETLEGVINDVNSKTRFTQPAVSEVERVSQGTRLITNKVQDGIFTKNAANLLSDQFKTAKVLSIRSKNTEDLFKAKVKKNAAKKNVYLTTKDVLDAWVGTKRVNRLREYINSKMRDIEFESNPTLFTTRFDDIIKDLSRRASFIFQKENIVSEFYEYVSKNKSGLNVKYDQALETFTVIGVPHRKLNELFAEFLLATKIPPHLVEFIDVNTDAGHLLGIFTVRIATLFSSNNPKLANIALDSDGIPTITFETISNASAVDEKANKLFRMSGQLCLNADAITSNLINNLQGFVDISRTNFSTTISGDKPGSAAEIQLSILNQEAGNKLANTAKKMAQLVDIAQRSIGNTTTDEEIKAALISYFDSFKPLADYIDKVGIELAKPEFANKVKQDVVEKLKARSGIIAQELLDSQGSDTFYTSLKKGFSALLMGTEYKGQKTKARATSKKVPNTKKSIGTFNPGSPIKSSKRSVKPAKPIVVGRGFAAQTTSTNLPSLLSKINALLQQQIRRNMGTGTSKNVLNYRTGRFAESVKVERLSESREGMITAFYSYMKNPYSTFSQGGRQERPASRDPKLLIAKSIREIAQGMITNRLRAVNV